MALVLALSAAGQPVAEPADRLARIRAPEPLVLNLIREGCRRSATFASLVARIEQSETLVYVVRGYRLRHGMEGYVASVGSAAPGHLRVVLAMGLDDTRGMAVLAHELQHVREVLDAGIAIEPAALETLFKRIGSPQLGTTAGEQYETAAATQVMKAVEHELFAHRPEHEPDPAKGAPEFYFFIPMPN